MLKLHIIRYYNCWHVVDQLWRKVPCLTPIYTSLADKPLYGETSRCYHFPWTEVSRILLKLIIYRDDKHFCYFWINNIYKHVYLETVKSFLTFNILIVLFWNKKAKHPELIRSRIVVYRKFNDELSIIQPRAQVLKFRISKGKARVLGSRLL